MLNEFITIGRTRCYFIDNEYHIRTGIIVGYNTLNTSVKIQYKVDDNKYIVVYRTRDTIWFDLEICLYYLIELLKGISMKSLYVMDLTSQLNGIDNILKLDENLGDSYTIYLNGLRQNREDYIVNKYDLTLTLLIDPIPNENDILTIEYWKYDDSTKN